VTVGSQLHATSVDSVHVDERRGVAMAVEHLVSLGHRDICHVDGGRAVLSQTRRESYLDSMAEHGLADRVRIIGGNADENSGVAAATELLAGTSLPTAVLAYNDMTAFGLLFALRIRGIDVPGDVSVVGYDDTRLATLRNVELTSVSQDPAEQAATAVQRAIARAEGQAAPASEFVTPPRLVVRQSSGRAPR